MIPDSARGTRRWEGVGAERSGIHASDQRVPHAPHGLEGEQPGYTMLSSPERFSSALEEMIQLIGRRTTELRTQLDAPQP